MKILGIGETCELGDMYWRLMRAGHEARVFVEDPASHDVVGGILHRTPEWRAELPWLRSAGTEGLVVFESAGKANSPARWGRSFPTKGLAACFAGRSVAWRNR